MAEMRLTARVDYALRAMAELVAFGALPPNVRDLAADPRAGV